MFGSSKKSETFKYEVEVNTLIREATAGLNQRVLALEITNQQLIQHNQKLEFELQTLRQTLYTDVQRLEKRITDFTDLWHPIMSENMNRIKAELEETIRQADREDIQKVSFDLENKLTKLLENSNNLMDNILVGYNNQFPIFAHKDYDLNQIIEKLKGDRCDLACSTLILKSLKYFKNAYFDPMRIHKLLDNNNIHNIFPDHGCFYTTEQYIQRKEVKQIYKLCKEYGIKFVINGQDRVNGVPLKMLFEDE